MWRAAAFADGNWYPLEVFELVDEAAGPFTSARARDVARGRLPTPQRHLLSYLEQEAQTPDLARDAIELWAKTAQADSERFDWAGAPKLRALEEALALYAGGETAAVAPGKPSALAWHDHTGILIPLGGTEERVLIEYVPTAREEQRLERLRHRYAAPDHELETILDMRGYFGQSSAIVDGWTTLRRSGKGYVASLKGTAGFVVGSVLRRLTRPEPTLASDPTAKARLIQMSERYPRVADGCPDLSTIDPAVHDAAIVFVHGTVSCGIQGLKDLLPVAAELPGPIYRYEHDTFLRLDGNGLELAGLIQDHLRVERLLLVAHSRGGLVAKIASDKLMKDGFRGDLALYSFGTPFLGTPLVAIGKKALNFLFKLGEDAVGALPLLTPLTKGFLYTVEAPTLPQGIMVMHEDSDGIALLRLLGDAARTRCWASDFRVGNALAGFGPFVEGMLLGAMRDRRHDLVVPTESALGFGVPQAMLGCSHVHYFQQPQVQAAIQGFFAPVAPPAVASTPSPSSGRLPVMAPLKLKTGSSAVDMKLRRDVEAPERAVFKRRERPKKTI
jgi:hypothetical protein